MIQPLKHFVFPQQLESAPHDGTVGSTGSGVVLLVDDEPEMRVIGRIALEQIGMKVIECGEGTTALALCQDRGQHISLVVTDVVMPRLDGFGLIRRLQAVRPDLPVILLSGHVVEEDLWGDAVAHVRYLPKPYHLQDLQNAVIDMMGPVLSESA